MNKKITQNVRQLKQEDVLGEQEKNNKACFGLQPDIFGASFVTV